MLLLRHSLHLTELSLGTVECECAVVAGTKYIFFYDGQLTIMYPYIITGLAATRITRGLNTVRLRILVTVTVYGQNQLLYKKWE